MKKYILHISLIGLLNTALLFFIKYELNDISIISLDLLEIGNIFNIIILIALIINSFLLAKSNLKILPHIKFIFGISALSVFPLIYIIIIKLANLEFSESYFLSYPLKKVLYVILFIINQITFVFVIYMTWFLRKTKNILAYIYSIFGVLVTLLVLISFSFISTFFVYEFDLQKDNNSFKYGIILGAAVWSGNIPSPIFSGRIDKGAKLYQKNIIEKIQLTGGNAPGELSEAKTASNYLRKKFRVPISDVLIEELTSTTNEQIRFIRNKLVKNNNDIVLLISDEFHLKRISEMAKFYDLNASVISSDYKLNIQKSLYYRFRDCIGLLLFWFFAI